MISAQRPSVATRRQPTARAPLASSCSPLLAVWLAWKAERSMQAQGLADTLACQIVIGTIYAYRNVTGSDCDVASSGCPSWHGVCPRLPSDHGPSERALRMFANLMHVPEQEQVLSLPFPCESLAAGSPTLACISSALCRFSWHGECEQRWRHARWRCHAASTGDDEDVGGAFAASSRAPCRLRTPVQALTADRPSAVRSGACLAGRVCVAAEALDGILDSLRRDGDYMRRRAERQAEARSGWVEGLSFKPASIQQADRPPLTLGQRVKESVDKACMCPPSPCAGSRVL